MSLISCENLAFAYDGVTVLQDLNFKIEQGDYFCILGENGAGKSTLMKGLLGLKKPSSGKVIFGEDLRAKEIGYLPQQTPVQKDFPGGAGDNGPEGPLLPRPVGRAAAENSSGEGAVRHQESDPAR